MTGEPAFTGRQAAAGGGGPGGTGGPPILDQPFDADSLYALRATLEAHASRAGLPEGRTGDLVLAVHELATNVILHGSMTGRVRIWHTGAALYCEVSDTGGPPDGQPDADPDRVPDGEPDRVPDGEPDAKPGAVPEWPYEYGHGLWIVACTADEHTVRAGPHGPVATVTFALPPPVRPAFRLTRRDEDGATRLELTGDLDQGTAPRLTAAVGSVLAERPAARIVVDLSGMTFWDSMGLAALVSAQQLVTAAPPATITVSGLPQAFRRRLDKLGFVPFAYSGDDDGREREPPG